MNRILTGVLALGLLLVTTGCAHNAIVAHESVRVGTFFGDLGIKGNGNSMTVLRGSRLTKVSFWGDHNTVTVEQGVTLAHVEFFGKHNTVSIPDTLMVRLTEVGEGNKVLRRETPPLLDSGAATIYELPPVEEATEPYAPTEPAEMVPVEEASPPDVEGPEEEPAETANETEPPEAAPQA